MDQNLRKLIEKNRKPTNKLKTNLKYAETDRKKKETNQQTENL